MRGQKKKMNVFGVTSSEFSIKQYIVVKGNVLPLPLRFSFVISSR